MIYEVIDNNITINGAIYKYYSDEEKMHILSILDIKKMIPVPTGCYERIKFDEFNSFPLPTPSENPASAYLFSPPFSLLQGYLIPWK